MDVNNEEIIREELENEVARNKVPFDRMNIVRDWRTILVNPWNPLPIDFKVNLSPTIDDYEVDERIKEDFEAMINKAISLKYKPRLISAYRNVEKQEKLFQNEVDSFLNKGMTKEDATTTAAKSTAKPGTSEHHTGLAVDIVANHYMELNDSQGDTGLQKWLFKNSYKYGFILRYPKDKTEITGINYEPWHYRYVGRDVAIVLYDNNLTLEEYLASEVV